MKTINQNIDNGDDGRFSLSIDRGQFKLFHKNEEKRKRTGGSKVHHTLSCLQNCFEFTKKKKHS